MRSLHEFCGTSFIGSRLEAASTKTPDIHHSPPNLTVTQAIENWLHSYEFPKLQVQQPNHWTLQMQPNSYEQMPYNRLIQ